MDLLYARARTTAEYLIAKGIDRRRLVVSAAGSNEPRKVTRRKELQKLNRRVDVFLIDSYITHPHPPDSLDR
jgi:flagellar motor protein MotB